jgi:serine protease Do
MEKYFVKTHSHKGLIALGALSILALGLVSGFYTARKNPVPSEPGEANTFSHFDQAEAVPVASVSTDYAEAREEIDYSRRNAIVRAVEVVQPAVVSVSVTQRVYQVSPFSFFSNDPFFERFFPELKQEYRRKVKGLGSGFIVNSEGYILTNEHVVRNAIEIVVNLPDGRQFDANLVDSDQSLDIAVLKINGENLAVAHLGNSNKLFIGEWAIALGNPLGYIFKDAHSTVTVGVVSALNRDFKSDEATVYQGMVQTDAAINPANSGGPLVNALGEVIGINTFIVRGVYEGIGFAIPINRAKKVLDEILSYGKMRNSWTGLAVQDVDPLIAQSLGLKSVQGVIIVNVLPKSPAEKAGLEVSDVILHANGTPIENKNQIRAVFAGGMVGDIYHLKVFRKGKKLKIDLILEERPKK